MTGDFAQGGPSQSLPLFNPSSLAELMGMDDPALFMDFYTTYLDQLSTLVPQLEAHAGNADIAGLREAAHKLKSSSRTVGAMQLGDALEHQEHAARDGDLAATVQWIAPITQLVALTTAAIAAEIVRLGGNAG